MIEQFAKLKYDPRYVPEFVGPIVVDLVPPTPSYAPAFHGELLPSRLTEEQRQYQQSTYGVRTWNDAYLGVVRVW